MEPLKIIVSFVDPRELRPVKPWSTIYLLFVLDIINKIEHVFTRVHTTSGKRVKHFQVLHFQCKSWGIYFQVTSDHESSIGRVQVKCLQFP